MGKFSYKKRKGTRKQSFKNRKRVKKGGDNGNGNGNGNGDGEEAATETTTTVKTNTEVTVDPKAEEKTGNEAGQTEAGQTGDAQTEAAAATDAGNEDAGQDWKDGQSEDAVKQAEQEVSDIEGKANDQGELDPEEINNLVNQLAEGKDVPLWAKALAKSGAAGTAAKILNKNPALRDALMKKGIDVINNADVSIAPGSASAPGAAAPGGSYTADDAGYQKFVEAIKTNPETLKNVVYVNDQMTQIFLKNPNGWTEIKK